MDRIIPISDLQTQAKRYVDQVRRTEEPVVITQRGRAAAVLVSFEAYEGFLATRDETAHGDWPKRLSRARRESAAGKTMLLETYLRRRGAKA